MKSFIYQNKYVYLQHECVIIRHNCCNLMMLGVRYFFILLALLLVLPIDGQNYVKTETCLDEGETHIVSEYNYYDGLGRRSVSASNGINTDGKYVYTMQTYDTNGREFEKWLPSVGTTTASCPFYSDFQVLSGGTYNQDNYAYSANLYNALDQVTTIESAGSVWRSENCHVQKRYDINAANEVKRYRAADGNSLVTTNGYYHEGDLTVEEIIDEDGKTSKVYKDFLERTILERSITGDSIYDTYYVYDARNQLCFVLTPEFQRAGWKDWYTYEYRYDDHGRMVKKFRPHCDEEHFYYDHDGRVIYIKDAVGNYTFNLYDNFGRRVIKGSCSNFNYHHYQNVSMASSGNGFLDTGYQYDNPSAITHAKLDEVEYYDNYSFLTKGLYSSSPHASLLIMQNPTNAVGLLTGRAVRTSSNQILLMVFYYDELGRMTDKRETLLNGGFRQTVTAFSFTDKPLSETSLLTVNGTTINATKTYEYYTTNDQLKKLTITYNGGSPVTVAEYEYNDLGNLSKLKRGGSAGNTNYSYNLRGWTTSITGNGFNEWLYYTDGKGVPYYSGSISSQQWQTDNEAFKRGYKFFYDGLGRMTKAKYAEGDNMDTHVDRYTEWVREYTFSSAIRKIERFGKRSGNYYGKIDNLRMYYNGMQISKVKEDAYPLTYTGAFEYVSDIIASEPVYRQYDYYEDGALKWDTAKGLSLINYNHFNTPKRVQFANGSCTEYEYSATGEKLRTIYRTAVPNITVPYGSTIALNSSNTLAVDSINYFGEFVFENGQMSKYLFSGGYATISNGQPTFHYYVQDHLGNNRAVINHNGTLEQVNHYYPFGAIYGDVAYNDGLQKYKYNGKELDRMHGLNFYDYGARQYDPLLGMFTQMDPMAEKYYNVSPYAYCAGDPVNAFDPDGMEIYILLYTSGNNRGDEMFKAAAETRKYDIEHSDYFDPANDIVLLIPIQDLAGISQLVENAVDTYSENFGKTAEFGIWSHASLDGPTGTVPTSTNAIDKTQMSIEGWGNIDFNWGNGATANFYGCRTGEGNGENASFATRVSSISNFKDVTVHGQTTSAYPSIYTNVRLNTQEMMKGKFSYPTYMVGGKSLGIIGRIFPTFSQANPMRSSTNGKSVVHNYYQQGRRF